MANVIITGTPEESKKAMAALKSQFHTIDKKADVFSRGEQTTVAEVFLDVCAGDNFSDEEVLKALECHSKKERDCVNCIYKKIPKCNERLLADAAVVVNKMHRQASQRSASNDDD